MFHGCSCFNLEAKLSLRVLAGTTAVILVRKRTMPVKQLFEIYLEAMLHISAATVLQKARERHCFISCGAQQSPSSLKMIVAT